MGMHPSTPPCDQISSKLVHAVAAASTRCAIGTLDTSYAKEARCRCIPRGSDGGTPEAPSPSRHPSGPKGIWGNQRPSPPPPLKLKNLRRRTWEELHRWRWKRENGLAPHTRIEASGRDPSRGFGDGPPRAAKHALQGRVKADCAHQRAGYGNEHHSRVGADGGGVSLRGLWGGGGREVSRVLNGWFSMEAEHAWERVEGEEVKSLPVHTPALPQIFPKCPPRFGVQTVLLSSSLTKLEPPTVLEPSLDKKRETQGKTSSPLSGSRKPDGWKSDFYLNLGVAVRTLSEDLACIFSKDLNYDIYREIGVELFRIWQPSETSIWIRWELQGVPRVPWEAKGRFQGTSRYKLDRKGKIYEHKVDNLVFNLPQLVVRPAIVLDLVAAYPPSPNLTFCATHMKNWRHALGWSYTRQSKDFGAEKYVSTWHWS
ncbi:hypothetical protein HPP92_028098 [Vanilla planifolia]|uniref:Uncharacterized protein n=1 Tax=Vanilla planifolia TaxID=51239 RepID=A0A835P6R2_VANPL|nr:hypothetical protein HPP92_028098 [Vanilla planifolia]